MDNLLSTFFDSYDAAWSSHDARAFTNHFLDNASSQFFTLDGKKIEMNNRDEMLASYTPSFESLQSKPTVGHLTKINRTQNFSTDVLLVDGDAFITEKNADGETVTVRKWAVSFLLTKVESGWKIFSLRASDRPLT